MKKSLIALAVLAASGVAMAQSSVTMYGVVDAGLLKSNGVSAQMMGSTAMNNGTSRLGVRGTEDLGGGLKAFFNLEHGLNPENGQGNLSGGQMWSRAAFLGLSGGFGSFTMGRQLNPSFWGIAPWELTGTANYSAVGTQFGYTAGGVRDSSMFMYSTPNMGGFGAKLGYIMKQDNGGNAKVDLALTYANGPLAAGLSYNKTNTFSSNMSLGAAYDFGMFKVAGSIQDNGGPSKGFTIGASAPVGPVSLTFDIARENGTGMKNTDFLLEAKYALSKRTFAYAVFYKDGDAGGGVYKTGAKNHLGLGVRHNF